MYNYKNLRFFKHDDGEVYAINKGDLITDNRGVFFKRNGIKLLDSGNGVTDFSEINFPNLRLVKEMDFTEVYKDAQGNLYYYKEVTWKYDEMHVPAFIPVLISVSISEGRISYVTFTDEFENKIGESAAKQFSFFARIIDKISAKQVVAKYDNGMGYYDSLFFSVWIFDTFKVVFEHGKTRVKFLTEEKRANWLQKAIIV